MVNLAAWFGLHTLFGTVADVQVAWARVPVPQVPSLDPFALTLTVAAFVAMYWGRLGIIPVVAASAAVGLLRQSVI
jgi:chromate transporter